MPWSACFGSAEHTAWSDVLRASASMACVSASPTVFSAVLWECMAAADPVRLPTQTFCRKFQWHELMLWPEDMPPHALVCLSHNDDLVPSPMVAKHIAGALALLHCSRFRVFQNDG